jgi:hypothetical protein
VTLPNKKLEEVALLKAQDKNGTEIAKILEKDVRAIYRALKRKDVRERVAEIVGEVLEDLGAETEDIVEAVCEIAFDPKAHKATRLQALGMLGKHTVFADKIKLEGGDSPIRTESTITVAMREKLDEIYKPE